MQAPLKIYHLTRRLLTLALLLCASLAANAAKYVITDGTNFLSSNGSTGENTTVFNATTCIWKGTSGSTFSCDGVYLRYDSGLEFTTTSSSATRWTISGNQIYYKTSGWFAYYIRYNSGWSASTTSADVLYEVNPVSKSLILQGIQGDDVISEVGTSDKYEASPLTYIPEYYDWTKGSTKSPQVVTPTSVTWSLTGYANASVSSDGKITVTSLPTYDTNVTLTATASYDGLNDSNSKIITIAGTTPATPTISNTPDKILIYLANALPGDVIRYTTDGTTPDGSSAIYTGPIDISSLPITIKAIACRGSYTSSVQTLSLTTDTINKTVYIDDWEDIDSWTYYTGIPTSIDANYNTDYADILYSPNARNIIIEYQGGSVSGASAVAISGITGEDQNAMTYYQTLEKSGDYYPYTVIPNPFSKRPRLTSASGTTDGFYGFSGWKITNGGEYIDGKSNGDILSLEEAINFTSGLPNYAKITFEAQWTEATVKTGTSSPTFNGGTYETNFWVITGGNVSNLTTPTNASKNMTVTMYYPNGVKAEASTRNITSGITLANTFTGTLKLEYLTMKTSGTINACGKNLYIGRGVTNSNTNGCSLYGTNTSGSTVNQTLRVESGKYSTMYHFGVSVSSGNLTKQLIILGCDYDRAKADNTNLEITGQMRGGNSISVNKNSGEEISRTIGKSGKFVSKFHSNPQDAAAEYCYYVGISGTHNKGFKSLEIQGGEWANIAGGLDENNNPNLPSFLLRIKGGTIHGSIYGAATFAGAAGIRTFVITGGTINGWIAGGANGTQSDGGELAGSTYIYVGGKASVNSSGSITRINRAVGGNVFGAGCGYSSSSESGQVTLGTNVVIADDAYVERGVYGGGSFGYCATGKNAKIYVTGGTVEGVNGGISTGGTSYNESVTGGVFGGACMNKGGSTSIVMTGGKVYTGIYGGSNVDGTLSGDVTLKLLGGTVGQSYSSLANVCGGGLGANTAVSGAVTMTIGKAKGDGPIVYGDIYGGSQEGSINTGTGQTNTITLNGGTIKGERMSSDYGTGGGLFGGGLGTATQAAAVNGNVAIVVNGGTVEDAVYGCNNVNGQPAGSVSVTVNGTDEPATPGTYAIQGVFGGGNKSAYSKVPTVIINKSDTYINYVFGGASATSVLGTDVTINGGNINNVFGGGNGALAPANVGASGTGLTITGGTINNVYAASNKNGPIAKTTIELNIEEATPPVCPVVIGDIYGGGRQAAYSGSTTVNFKKGKCTGAIYGGGALADVDTNTAVNLTGGTVHDVYGGGLGSAETAAIVGGNASVILDGSIVTGSVFGGNNLNGTPQGHIFVNVKQTSPKEGQATGDFDVEAVFGGGNMAAYEPSATNLLDDDVACTEVVIDGCSTCSIGSVYGGGNAAPVPATKVYILGAKKIGYVYGGGNGADVLGSEDNVIFDNPGANVGWNNKINKEENSYGAGTTHVWLYGGEIVNWVFGGSNTKGLIRTFATVTIDESGTYTYPDLTVTTPRSCALNIGQAYSSGRIAPMYCGSKLEVKCIGRLSDIYGGSYMANVGKPDHLVDIELNISSGNIERVFGGNNESGEIFGSITVNIDETGCTPIVIGKVYGCGNKAAYNKPATANHPTVNIYSCSSIGSVFGGGYGSSAVVTANPTVNIWQIPGIYNEDGTTVNTTKLGTIGNVYGGGDEAAVVGNTTVNIATKSAPQTHIDTSLDASSYTVGANIIGSVFGGGNIATVSGTTQVQVGVAPAP